MWRLTFALAAAGLSACSNVDIDRDPVQNAYTLTYRTDVIDTSSNYPRLAAEQSGDICPAGWQLISMNDQPPGFAWEIRCLSPASAKSFQLPVPPA